MSLSWWVRDKLAEESSLWLCYREIRRLGHRPQDKVLRAFPRSLHYHVGMRIHRVGGGGFDIEDANPREASRSLHWAKLCSLLWARAFAVKRGAPQPAATSGSWPLYRLFPELQFRWELAVHCDVVQGWSLLYRRPRKFGSSSSSFNFFLY